jgi:hypothetical protein
MDGMNVGFELIAPELDCRSVVRDRLPGELVRSG